MSAVGSRVDQAENLSQLDKEVDLLLVHSPTDPSALQPGLAALAGKTNTIVVLAKPGLGAIISGLRLPTVRSVVAEEHADSRLLTYVSSKLLWGDIFGISKVLPWGVRTHSELINSHEDRTTALASVARFVESLGIRPKYRETIELVVDELVMNALYNAPVSPEGKPLFDNVSPRERGGLRLERPVILQMACDGARFALGVRDSFGSLKRDTILDYIERCLKSKDQIDRKVSGAGLGLYLAVNSVTEFIANILPGTATEIVCIFDIRAPGQQLKHMGIYEESYARFAEVQREKRQSRLMAPVQAQSSAMPKAMPVTLGTAVLLLIMATVLLILPYIQRPGKGSVKVTVNPSGAMVYMNGLRRGAASPTLMVPDVEVGPYAISAVQAGYATIQDVITVVKNQVHAVHLTLPLKKARVRVVSQPSTALVYVDGKSTGLRTPTLVENLEPGRRYVVRLEKHGFVDAKDRFTPTAEETLLLQVTLPMAPGFAQLSLDSQPSGARLLVNKLDTGLSTPVTGYVLRAGQAVTVQLQLPKRVPWEKQIRPKEGEQIREAAELPQGGALTLRANVAARATIGTILDAALPVKDAPIPDGSYRVRLRADQPYLDYEFPIVIKGGMKLHRLVQFGFVATKKKSLRIKLGDHRASRVALPVGTHEVTVLDTNTQQIKTETVELGAKKTIYLDW